MCTDALDKSDKVCLLETEVISTSSGKPSLCNCDRGTGHNGLDYAADFPYRVISAKRELRGRKSKRESENGG